MRLIISHTNADFDSLSGMVALSKIYENSILLLPGSLEKNLKDFIETNKEKLPKIFSPREFNFEKIDEVILVDVTSSKRVGSVWDKIKNKKLILFDHHPLSDDKIKENFDNRIEEKYIEECASVTSFLVHLLKEKGIKVNEFEATLFLLGIYEDSGFLSFITVKTKDFDAAKLCLQWGANISEISRWLHRRLTSEQMKILNRLVENLEVLNVGGLTIYITTFHSTEFYADLSFLLQELINVENVDAIFLVAYLENRIHIIGRSRSPNVNVAKILESFGGGGHSSAASATLKKLKTVDEIKRELIDFLLTQSNIGYKAKEFCVKNFIKGNIKMTVEEALREMINNRINSLPIFDGDRVVGVVTRQEVDKTYHLKLGDKSVMTLVASPPPIVAPEDSIEKVTRLMLEKSLRLILVGKSEREIEGIITRMELFKKLYKKKMGDQLRIYHGIPSQEEIRKILENRLSKEFNIILRVGEIASQKSMKCYLVGGVVRDILLNRDIKDLDFVVEGSAEELVKEIVKEFGGTYRTHSKFQTAIWLREEGNRWDFATARTEQYDYSASLPKVFEAPLIVDLLRRDFTINAMAISINPDNFGLIIDNFGGIKDLKQSFIRLLHGVSILDDPTRAFRAIRLAAKLNFKVSEETKNLILNALKEGIFNNLSPKRVLNEMFEIFKTDSFINALKQLEKLGLLKIFSPYIKLTPKELDKLYEAQKVISFFEMNFPSEEVSKPIFYLMTLLDRLKDSELKSFVEKYPFTSKEKKILLSFKQEVWQLKRIFSEGIENNKKEILKILFSTPLLILLHFLAHSKSEKEKILIKDFLQRIRFIKLEINGEDLKKIGLKPSKAFSEILFETKVKKIEGSLKSKEEELQYAIKLATEMGFIKNNEIQN